MWAPRRSLRWNLHRSTVGGVKVDPPAGDPAPMVEISALSIVILDSAAARRSRRMRHSTRTSWSGLATAACMTWIADDRCGARYNLRAYLRVPGFRDGRPLAGGTGPRACEPSRIREPRALPGIKCDGTERWCGRASTVSLEQERSSAATLFSHFSPRSICASMDLWRAVAANRETHASDVHAAMQQRRLPWPWSRKGAPTAGRGSSVRCRTCPIVIPAGRS